MESIAQDLAEGVVDRLSHIPSNSRLLVGISGIPASGKSTLAVLVTSKTNQLLAMDEVHHQSVAASTHSHNPFGRSRAILVGLDGWHLTRAQLDALPDPKLAYDRRGSHWTFDGHGYVLFVRSLREPVSGTSTITAPSFDHAIKDPSPHAVRILPEHRIVIIEGLYTFLSLPPWAEAGRLLDERWLIELDPTVASNRIVKRHVVSGVAKDLEEARWRSVENDTPNGHFLLANSLEPTRTIQSVDDPNYTLS
ncbi:P-loop containing nucleoside triphosphate hydrolase protein [Lactarius deliciosus]|nr:P-loop containing nucleoside triphosphate hydrolase protein [Lactarius deliciosus]KAH9075651.1 P-loop containing nucleoside triphosphate hydrolase protein [Lactarius deliciosus]